MFSYLHEIRWSVGFEALKCEMLGRVALEARLSESRFTTRHMRRLVACWSIRRECATIMIRLEFWPDKSADIQISTNISGTPCMDSIKTSVLFFVLTRKKNSSFYYKMRKHRGLMEKKKWSTSETWASFFFFMLTLFARMHVKRRQYCFIIEEEDEKVEEEGEAYSAVSSSSHLELWRFSAKTPKSTAADVKMVIPVLVRSLKSSILSSTSFQMGKTFWVVVSAAVESNLGVKPTWLLRETGNSALEADPRIPPNQKKNTKQCHLYY